MNAVKSEYDDDTVKDIDDDGIPTSSLAVMASAPKSAAVAYTKLLETDVILSLPRHHRIYYSFSLERHPGNIAYKKLVSLNRYLVASSSLSLDENLRVAQTIVVSIRQMRGRFLECRNDNENGNKPNSHHRIQLSELDWREVDDARAIELTSNSLRERPSEELFASTAVETTAASATSNAPLRSARVENSSRATNNNINAQPLINVPAEIARDASPPVPLEIATVKSAQIATKKSIDSSMLINLSPAQTVNLNFPVGSKVLYNVDCTSEQYSDANTGFVKSVSMDLLTRNMLYAVGHLNGSEKGNNDILDGGRKQDGDDNLFFTEEKLSIAPLSPVTIDMVIRGEELQLEGKVLSCQALHGTGNTAKKVYTVLVHIENNKVRMFHEVSEECIRCRLVAEEPESRNQQETTQPQRTQSKGKLDVKGTSLKPLRDGELQNGKGRAMSSAIATESQKDVIASQVSRACGNDGKKNRKRSKAKRGSNTKSNGNRSNLGKSHWVEDGQNSNRDNISPGSGDNQHKKIKDRGSFDSGKKVHQRKSTPGRTEEEGGGHNHDEKMEGGGKAEGKALKPKNGGISSSSAGTGFGKRSTHIRFDAPVEAASESKRQRRGT